jgi:hypothetical protein
MQKNVKKMLKYNKCECIKNAGFSKCKYVCLIGIHDNLCTCAKRDGMCMNIYNGDKLVAPNIAIMNSLNMMKYLFKSYYTMRFKLSL